MRIEVAEAGVVYVSVGANRRKMRLNRELFKGDLSGIMSGIVSGIEPHETE
ncbi:MAG TPA: hypothetical protein VGB76_02780 [Pyrinomonadaceae bacterium]